MEMSRSNTNASSTSVLFLLLTREYVTEILCWGYIIKKFTEKLQHGIYKTTV